MSNDPHLNQRIKRVLKKLTKIQKLFFWFRLLLWLVAYRARRYMAGLFVRPRSRVHWAGRRQRLPRPERSFIFLVFAIAIVLLKPREYAVWATISGGFTAMMVPFISLQYLLRAHWVRSE
jgi:hypothetical protein